MSKQYKINDEGIEIIGAMRSSYYAKKSGYSVVSISHTLNGYPVSQKLAKLLIAIRYDMSISDNNIEELFAKYFNNI